MTNVVTEVSSQMSKIMSNLKVIREKAHVSQQRLSLLTKSSFMQDEKDDSDACVQQLIQFLCKKIKTLQREIIDMWLESFSMDERLEVLREENEALWKENK